MSIHRLISERFFPHLWCPGCGHGIVLNALLRAVDELGLDRSSIVMVSGIGCSARMSGYVDFHSMHTLHGRALAFASGIKLTRPELTVIAPMGDGDGLAIGGNHFIHAARRNIDITALILNNRIYGMTGGQISPLSGRGAQATTAPYAGIDPEFDTVQLALGAGASFAARSTTLHVKELREILKKAITHKGFSLVEVLSQCPTYFGRRNNMGDAANMMRGFRDTTAKLGSKKLEENPHFLARGIFKEATAPEYCEEYARMATKAGRKA